MYGRWSRRYYLKRGENHALHVFLSKMRSWTASSGDETTLWFSAFLCDAQGGSYIPLRVRSWTTSKFMKAPGGAKASVCVCVWGGVTCALPSTLYYLLKYLTFPSRASGWLLTRGNCCGCFCQNLFWLEVMSVEEVVQTHPCWAGWAVAAWVCKSSETQQRPKSDAGWGGLWKPARFPWKTITGCSRW